MKENPYEPSPAAPKSRRVVWPLRNGHTITFTPTYRGRPGYRLYQAVRAARTVAAGAVPTRKHLEDAFRALD